MHIWLMGSGSGCHRSMVYQSQNTEGNLHVQQLGLVNLTTDSPTKEHHEFVAQVIGLSPSPFSSSSRVIESLIFMQVYGCPGGEIIISQPPLQLGMVKQLSTAHCDKAKGLHCDFPEPALKR